MIIREHTAGHFTAHYWPATDTYWDEHAERHVPRKPRRLAAAEARYYLTRHCHEPVDTDHKSCSADTVQAWNIGPLREELAP
jgi:hypothetical protein